jgi:hypothetical protein
MTTNVELSYIPSGSVNAIICVSICQLTLLWLNTVKFLADTRPTRPAKSAAMRSEIPPDLTSNFFRVLEESTEKTT